MERKAFMNEAAQPLERPQRPLAGESLRMPGARSWWLRGLLKLVSPRQPASRSYRYLARQLAAELKHQDRPAQVAVTSPSTLDESTGAVLMLAYCLQDELDAKVLIVDATLGHAGAGACLGFQDAPGFMDAVYSEKYDADALVHPTTRRGIAVLPAGMPPAVGFSPLRAEKVQGVLAKAGQSFDYLLIQQGSVLEDTRYILLASQADITLVLVEERVTLLEELENYQRVLADHDVANARVIMVQKS
jgi:Mrp family chromosome partitioning ATPase